MEFPALEPRGQDLKRCELSLILGLSGKSCTKVFRRNADFAGFSMTFSVHLLKQMCVKVSEMVIRT